MPRATKKTAASSRQDGPPAPLPEPRALVGSGAYVRCAECGGMRMPGGVHGATHVSNPPNPWPQCAHGWAYMVDCTSNAVPPPCCRGAE